MGSSSERKDRAPVTDPGAGAPGAARWPGRGRWVVSSASGRSGVACSPASLVLGDFERLNARAGHENAGFLSTTHGFVPRTPPLTRLPQAFAAWDELAAELPVLHRDLLLRRRVRQLPLLDASQASLEDGALLRACALLAVVAHAYWYVEPHSPEELPESVRRPWAQVRARLARSGEVISYIDLIVYNWRLIDPYKADPMVVENLELLLPTLGNREERVFYLTQLEILSRASRVVQIAAAAQDAVLREDDAALEEALVGTIDMLSRIVRGSLLKLDPNPHSETYVDPVVWAKTVAPFAVPFHAGLQGPSGTSSPLFNTLDLLFGRKAFESFLGREIKQLRGTYPRAWQGFLGALTKVSVADYVARSQRGALCAAFRDALDLYAGDNGFLGRHRMKVYGYLELAFKVGRSVTIGGFSGVFTDRTWDLVDNELLASQAERLSSVPHGVQRAKVIDVVPEETTSGPLVRRVSLDVSRTPIRYQPGDRCLILPENDPRLIGRTLAALGARGDELVEPTDEWKAQAKLRPELARAPRLAVRDVLRFGAIRPVSPRLAEALHARTQSRELLRQIVDGHTESFELWELLERLARHGLEPRTLWSEPGVEASARLCRLIPPLRFRVYSISSAAYDAHGEPNPVLELTVGQLRYASVQTPDEADELRFGTASSFLIQASERGQEVPFLIERPDRFVLPEEPETPVLLFAGGTGVAPFRAFLRERLQGAQGCANSGVRGANWLFLSVRAPQDFLYADELSSATAAGALQLRVAFTRVGAALELDAKGDLVLRPAPTRRIEELMLVPETARTLWELALPKSEGGAGAHLYICGRSGFARNVLETLKVIFRRYRRASGPSAEELLYRLAGERRLAQELHSDVGPVEAAPRRFDFSEVAEHNDAQHGYWCVIDRAVYDLTEFMELHPGGRRVVQAYAGMDATHGFGRAHHQRADVDAMRESYRIGVLRSYTFDDHAVRVEGPLGALTVDAGALHRSFVHAVQLAVEMQNALAADQALQGERLGPHDPLSGATPYKLLRALETHQRFVGSYLSVLVSETLPGLWQLSRGLLFPEERADWMKQHLEQLCAAEAAARCEALAVRVFREFDVWRTDPRTPAVARALERADAGLLAALKRALIDALREFEQHALRLRESGADSLKAAVRRAALAIGDYYAQLAGELAHAVVPVAAPQLTVVQTQRTPAAAKRLHSGTYWTLEVDAQRNLAVLQRTPVALASLAELRAENEQVLSCLTQAHRDYGLVVDTRRAPLRNDVAFEDAMAALRHGLTAHFRRTAVLLETNIGELQVSRLERDERRHALATRSESTAFKFVLGGR
jgi:sulfite reductase alpha subunit-like flavoprotein/cytochrome b involved in lipid metabolism